MEYNDVLNFVNEMEELGYKVDDFGIKDWENDGIGFVNDDKNIFVLCFFDSRSMTIYPNIPSFRKYAETFDVYLDSFEKIRSEMNNAHDNLKPEYEKLAKKYGGAFKVKITK